MLRQGCDSQGIKILQGSMQPDHVHMLLSCPANLAPVKLCRT
ncbi:transposase [Enterocloster clostridioformis]|nr:transposase [Enterocloster clostridioformis]MDB2150042.1 transposase [Enterocloster clostridioformis]